MTGLVIRGDGTMGFGMGWGGGVGWGGLIRDGRKGMAQSSSRFSLTFNKTVFFLSSSFHQPLISRSKLFLLCLISFKA